MTKRVLVVEDDKLAVTTLARVLSRAGWDVHEASSAHAARVALDGEHFDCVVLDRRLPDGDGLVVARELRASGARCRLVILSGEPQDDEDSIVDAYLLKPPSVADLLNALETDRSRPPRGRR